MSQFANLAAIAIERLRLLEETRQRNKELLAMNEITSAVSRTLDLQKVLDEILQHLLEITEYESGLISVVDPDTHKLQLAVQQNLPEKMVIRLNEKGMIGTPCDLVFQTGQTMHVPDLSDPPVKLEVFAALLPGNWPYKSVLPVFDGPRSQGFLSYLGVPLSSKGVQVGTICLFNRTVRSTSPALISLLEAIGKQVGVAVENARLYEEVQRYAGELEDRVAERTAQLSGRIAQVEELNRAMADLLRDLQEANRRLEETGRKLQAANAGLETFAYSVSHDLKAPLRGIDGYSHLLFEQYASQLDEEGKTFLQNIRRATAHMAELIDDLLTYSRLELQELTARPVNARALVEDLLAERLDEIERRKIQTTVEIPFKFITCDAEGLAQAMRNLLDNAIKFTRETPEPHIQIGGRKNSGTVILWVRDNGVGFDLKYHDRIFEIFQRLYTSDAYPGTGIGLSIVRKVMQRMGGRSWAESELGNGATFYLEFPVEKSHRRESNP